MNHSPYERNLIVPGSRSMLPVAMGWLLSLLLVVSCGPGTPPGGDGPAEGGPVNGPVESGGGTAGEKAASWQPIETPAGKASMSPQVVEAGGKILMSWQEPSPASSDDGGRVQRVRFARLEAGSWTEPSTVAEGSGFFVNWADFPAPAQARDGSLIAHWLQKSGASPYAYDIRLARSTDGGRSWAPLGKLNDDDIAAEHGFVSFVREGEEVRAFWLDGREMPSPEGHGDGAGHGEAEGEHAGSMGLRTALVGKSIGPSTLLDPRTCECCQTSAAVTAKGPVVVYRDRLEGEIRDIAIVRREGSGWTAPQRIHEDGWEVPGCPVNGPAVAASGETVVVAWYTAARNEGRVLAAFSTDAGATFAPPVVVDDKAPQGRVDVDLLPEGQAVVTWLASAGSDAVIRLRRVSALAAGGPLDLARTSAARAAGFPRTAILGTRIIVGWTEPGEEGRVRAAEVPATLLPPLETGGTATGTARDAASGSGALSSLALEDLDGKPIDLKALRGRPLLLNLWATWCSPCRAEMPVLAALHAEHAGAGLEIVGLSLDAAAEGAAVREFVRREGIAYRVLHDVGGRAASHFGISMLPASFLYDRDGSLVWQRRGLLTDPDPALREAIEKVLSSPRS